VAIEGAEGRPATRKVKRLVDNRLLQGRPDKFVRSESVGRERKAFKLKTGIKQATIFIGHWALPDVDQMEEKLSKRLFQPCGPTETEKAGFAPMQEGGALVTLAGGYRAMRVTLESKGVPGAIIAAEVEKVVRKIEAEQDRKVGKKESREIKEDVIKSLLPKAFAKTAHIHLLMGKLDNGQSFIVADSASAGKVDDAMSELHKAMEFDGVTEPLRVQEPVEITLARWLMDEEAQAAGFSVGKSAKLEAADKEMGGVITLKNERLNREEVKRYITEGRSVRELSVTWQDRIEMTVTDELKLKKMVFLEPVFNDAGRGEGEGGEQADLIGSIAIVGAEMSKLVSEVTAAFGGLRVRGGG